MTVFICINVSISNFIVSSSLSFSSNTFISNDREIADICNDYFINVIKYTQHTVSNNITDIISETNMDATIDNIIDMYKDHPSIQRIKIMNSEANTFSFRPVSEEEVILKLKSID